MAVERATIESDEAPNPLALDLVDIIKAIEVDEATEGGILPLVPIPPDEFLVFGSRTILAPAYASPRLVLGHSTIIEPDHT